MKYLVYIFLLVLPLLGSCEDDFLSQTPDDLLTTDFFYRDIDDAESALATVYAQIGAADRWNVSEVNFVVEHFRSDLCQPGPDSWNYPDWSSISTFSNTIGNSRVTIYWEDAYRGINHANQVINNVSAMTEEQIKPEEKAKIVAEARFLRAFLHFRLLNNWESIILQTEAPTNEEELEKPLSTREEVWPVIEADFRTAAADLPDSYDDINVGRATKGAAVAFLGKAFLYQGKFSEAAAEFKKLVENGLGNYSLVDNFLSSFDGSNENNDESVFEIQYSAVRSNGRHIGHVLGKFTSPNETGGWGNIEANQILLDVFKAEGQIASTGKYDSRLYQTLFFDDPDVNVFGKSYQEVFGDSERLIFRKYMLSDRPESENDAWYSSQNVPVMRYADVLLMYAEALNELGKTADAKQYVDRVRERADMPVLPAGLSQSEMRDRIIHERAVELAYEGHRFFDLRRWGKLDPAMKNSGKTGASNFNLGKHAFFPIPESETNTNSNIK